MRKFLFCFLVLISFISCNQNANSGDKGVIDLRNKDAVGNICRAVEDVDLSFVGQEIDVKIIEQENQNYGFFSLEEAKKYFKLYHDERGVKLTVNKPEVFPDNLGFKVNINYIDNNGNWSTKLDVSNSHFRDEYGIELFKQTTDVIFPLVLPNKETYLVIQYYFLNAYGPSVNFAIGYKFVPKYGLGVIDDLPLGWNSEDYISVQDYTLYLHDVIPVEAIEVKEQAEIWLKPTNETYQWDGGTYYKNLTEEADDLLSFELPKDLIPLNYKALVDIYKYIFVSYSYFYKIDGIDYGYFFTPSFLTEHLDINDFVETEDLTE